jgi:hypothetical protein
MHLAGARDETIEDVGGAVTAGWKWWKNEHLESQVVLYRRADQPGRSGTTL